MISNNSYNFLYMTGTTWMQEIVSALVNKGDLDKLNKTHTAFRVPYLELSRFGVRISK